MDVIRGLLWGLGVVVLAACTGSSDRDPEAAISVPRSADTSVLNAVGKMLALQGLLNVDDRPSSDTPVGPAGTLVLVVDAADCMSCLSIQAEAWDVSRIANSHRLGFVTVFEGQDTAVTHGFVRKTRLPGVTLFDPEGRVMRTLGPHPHPLVIWQGPTGKIIAMLPRTMGAPSDAVRVLLDEARAGGVVSPGSGG